MLVAGFPNKGSSRGGANFLVWCLGSLFLVNATFATSGQSLQHLLKHPHYADDGHQHARQPLGQGRGHSQREAQQDQIPTIPAIPSSSRSREVDRGLSSFTQHDSRLSSSWNLGSTQSAVSTTHHHHQTQSSSASESAFDSSRTPTPAGKFSSSTREHSTVHRGASTTTAVPREFYRFVTGAPDVGRKHRKNFGMTPPPSYRMSKGVDREVEEVREANEHYMKMRGVGRCKTPKEVVVHVKDYYPDPTKEYLPRCTLLHRCSDDAGCCDTEEFQCMPKAMQEVALSFYIIDATLPVHHMGLHNTVEKLLFVNHTECECLPKNDTLRVQDKPKAQRDDHRHHSQTRDQRTTSHQQNSKCRECPLPFCKREHPDGRCSCDCFDRQKPCIRVKRGREPLLETERRCVETSKCHIPDCEYGRYDSSLGRCPKRPEDLPRKGGSGNKNHHNQRWNYLERD